MVPDPKCLCTEAARDPAMIQWALRRSVSSSRFHRGDAEAQS